MMEQEQAIESFKEELKEIAEGVLKTKGLDYVKSEEGNDYLGNHVKRLVKKYLPTRDDLGVGVSFREDGSGADVLITDGSIPEEFEDISGARLSDMYTEEEFNYALEKMTSIVGNLIEDTEADYGESSERITTLILAMIADSAEASSGGVTTSMQRIIKQGRINSDCSCPDCSCEDKKY